MTYAIAAAGTGGHVYPALAVADALLEAGVSGDDIIFIGGDRMESRVVPAAGYEFIPLEIRGLQRSATLRNLTLPAMVRRAAARIADELHARGTRVVIAFGGYVSVPAALAARRSGAHLFLHEQNAVPGLANRLATRWAEISFVAFPGATDRLRRTRVVGNPLRPVFGTFDRDRLHDQALDRYGVPAGIPVLGVLGGSLGARVLNELAHRIAQHYEPGQLGIVHLTGPEHLDDVRSVAESSPLDWYTTAFEEDMEYFYAAADVVLSRAGALTMSELAATGTPAVVVPYAAGTAGHQASNAAELEGAGAVVVVTEADHDRVPVEVEQLLADDGRRMTMAKSAAAAARPDAAARVAGTLMEAAG